MGDGNITDNELENLLQGGGVEDELGARTESEDGVTQHPDFLMEDVPIVEEKKEVSRNWSWQGQDKSMVFNLFNQIVKNSVPVVGASVYKKIALGEVKVDLLTKAEIKTLLDKEFTVFNIVMKNFLNGEARFLISREDCLSLLSKIVSAPEPLKDFTEDGMERLNNMALNFVEHFGGQLSDKLYSEVEFILKDNQMIEKVDNPIFMEGGDTFLYLKAQLFIEGIAAIGIHFIFPVDILDNLIPLLKQKAAYEMESSKIRDELEISSVSFPSLGTAVDQIGEKNSNLLLDVQMPVSVELGKTKMYIKDIIALGEGSIIELDKLAGEPVDLLVNNKLIARGEVVVIDENFGVRITDIISPMSRIKVSNIDLDS